MRTIKKRNEPDSLTHHRLAAHADYDNYADKDTLRQSLVSEQRGLCCYCLSRIRAAAGEMKIAHWHSRDLHPDEQLVYVNLLGACMGNEGQSFGQQHCDSRQGNRDISRNPANPKHQVEKFIRFEGDGRITSNDQVFDNELNEILNLNLPFLKNNRKAALDAFKATLVKRGELQRTTLERWLHEWNGEAHAGELKPFCQVIVYWLHKRLAHT